MSAAVVSLHPDSPDFAVPDGPIPLTHPERAFLGCLLWLPAATVAALLAEVTDADVESRAVAALLVLVRRLAVAGIDPEPVAVLAEAERHRWQVEGIAHAEQLSRLLLDAVTGLRSATPHQAAYYRDAMLSRARRRALRALGVALVQTAEECPDDLISDRETALITGYRATRTRIVTVIGGDAP